MKRWIFKLVVFLLLGAIVNVAVAWGCAAIVDPYAQYSVRRWPGAHVFPRPVLTRGSSFPLLPAEVYVWVWNLRAFGTSIYFYLPVARDAVPRDLPRLEEVLPSWASVYSLENLNMHVVIANGWPLGACSAGQQGPRSSPAQYKSEWGLVLPKSYWVPTGATPLPRVLGLRPIWPGFAINTIFYAAILWLLMLGPFAARRVTRHKRGLCINCGYDLRGTSVVGCPECGWRREDVP